MLQAAIFMLAISSCVRAEIGTDDSDACMHDSDTCAEESPSAVSLLQTKMDIDKTAMEMADKAQAGPKIMVLGDSGAQMSCKDIGRFCGGSTVVNKAMGGSRAKHWAEGKCLFGDKKQGEKQSATCPEGESCCNATRAFDPKYGSGYTHVWLSLGGNDFLDNQPCGSFRGARLSNLVEAAIAKIRSAGPPGLKFVITGYVIPASHTTPYSFAAFGCGTSPATVVRDYFIPLNNAIKAAADAQTKKGFDVTYVDPAFVTGATSTSWSPKSSHSDAIHLNSKGNCKVFSMDAMQRALGCTAANKCSSQQCDSMAEGFVKEGAWLMQKDKKDSAMAMTEGAGKCAKLPMPACGSKKKKTVPCKNDDAGLAAAAAEAGAKSIRGCGDLDATFCSGKHKKIVKKLCPALCNSCGETSQ